MGDLALKINPYCEISQIPSVFARPTRICSDGEISLPRLTLFQKAC